MQKWNYKSDLDFVLVLIDGDGKEVKYPEWDFKVVLYTDGARRFTAASIGGKTTNCYNDGGRLHVVMNDHGLGPGRMRADIIVEMPNPIYPDGRQRLVYSGPVGAELVPAGVDIDSGLKAEMRIQLSWLTAEMAKILEEVNAQLEAILGAGIVIKPNAPNPSVPAVRVRAPYRLAEYVSRGMMPVEARPGVVYRVLNDKGRSVPGKYQTVGTDGEVVVLEGYFPVRKLAEPSQQEMERFIREGWNESHRLGKTGYYRFEGIAYEVQRRRSFTKDVWRDDRPVTKKYNKWCHTKNISSVGVIRVRRVPARASSVPPGDSCRSRSKASATEWRYFSILGERDVKRL